MSESEGEIYVTVGGKKEGNQIRRWRGKSKRSCWPLDGKRLLVHAPI